MTAHNMRLVAREDQYCGDAYERSGRSFCIETEGLPGHTDEIAQRVRPDDARRLVDLWNQGGLAIAADARALVDRIERDPDNNRILESLKEDDSDYLVAHTVMVKSLRAKADLDGERAKLHETDPKGHAAFPPIRACDVVLAAALLAHRHL